MENIHRQLHSLVLAVIIAPIVFAGCGADSRRAVALTKQTQETTDAGSLDAGSPEKPISKNEDRPTASPPLQQQRPIAPALEVPPATAPEADISTPTQPEITKENLPAEWIACKRHKDCVLLETDCCAWVAVHQKHRARARTALPYSRCDMVCSQGPTRGRCRRGRCRMGHP